MMMEDIGQTGCSTIGNVVLAKVGHGSALAVGSGIEGVTHFAEQDVE